MTLGTTKAAAPITNESTYIHTYTLYVRRPKTGLTDRYRDKRMTETD